jgi:hypothetical protein
VGTGWFFSLLCRLQKNKQLTRPHQWVSIRYAAASRESSHNKKDVEFRCAKPLKQNAQHFAALRVISPHHHPHTKQQQQSPEFRVAKLLKQNAQHFAMLAVQTPRPVVDETRGMIAQTPRFVVVRGTRGRVCQPLLSERRHKVKTAYGMLPRSGLNADALSFGVSHGETPRTLL